MTVGDTLLPIDNLTFINGSVIDYNWGGAIYHPRGVTINITSSSLYNCSVTHFWGRCDRCHEHAPCCFDIPVSLHLIYIAPTALACSLTRAMPIPDAKWPTSTSIISRFSEYRNNVLLMVRSMQQTTGGAPTMIPQDLSPGR